MCARVCVQDQVGLSLLSCLPNYPLNHLEAGPALDFTFSNVSQLLSHVCSLPSGVSEAYKKKSSQLRRGKENYFGILTALAEQLEASSHPFSTYPLPSGA